ncbi:hypothetical protein [Caballeronia sp. M1242]|uniref:hypothetical protein n=1 Tax=Caballeronia sp. M1242 TaxID=2814653 RepID=UPI0019D1243A|nr:hypothetical protein [Caballeronia sp. M1242]QSN63517.1 hypothetical protein JYK05_14950 [Caballeronia sp. M1242]
MRQSKSQLLAQESAEWHHRGLISAAVSAQLGRRYDRESASYSGLISWLALSAMCLLGFAVLAIIVLSSQSATLGGGILGAAAVALWYRGIRMTSDPLKRHPVTGSALVTVGLAAAYGAMTLLTLPIGDSFNDTRFSVLLTVTAALSMATAYQYHLRWPLLLSLLCLFHGLGAWHEYAGNGDYIANIQDPRTMAVIAALCANFGLWHQHAEEGRLRHLVGFGRLYVIFGLLYLDCSLWFLSLASYGEDHVLRWVLLFSAICVAQIIAGARLKEGKLTGFGIVFLSIDLYTRFFEHFWGRLSLGLFLLIAGLSAVVLGWLFERHAGAATA